MDVVCARSVMCTGTQACPRVRECASARALVAEHFQKSERSWDSPWLHPEVFAARATQLTETKQRETIRRLAARRWLSATPWRPQPLAPPAEARHVGSQLRATRRLLHRSGGHRLGLRETRHPPGPREEEIPYKIAMVPRKGSQQNIE